MTSEAEVSQALEEIARESLQIGAPLNGMVACAGIQQRVPALDYSPSDFERMLRVNVVGAFISVKAAARMLRDEGRKGGSIVLIASMSGQVANRVCVLDIFLGYRVIEETTTPSTNNEAG